MTAAAKCFRAVQILNFRAYKEGPMPILKYTWEITFRKKENILANSNNFFYWLLTYHKDTIITLQLYFNLIHKTTKITKNMLTQDDIC